MTTDTTNHTLPVRFHLSLNVSDLPRAVEFFERVLGVPVAKRREDYAKFEIDSPPLTFSLEPRSPSVHGSLNHVGFRFPDAAMLVDVQRRLEQAGIRTEREEGVECRYARQTKFWVDDLDHRLWEFYTLEEDIEHRGAGQSLETMIGADAAARKTSPAREPIVYEHFMGQPFAPPTEPYDEIRLRGTFNLPLTANELPERLNETRQHLRPGGKIHLHQLTSDVPLPDEALNLPGRASIVKHIPLRIEVLEALDEAGFRQIALTKFGSTPCFNVNGTELRETMIEAHRAADGCCEDRFDVVYRGPFASIQDDEGHIYPRGERVAICASTWQFLDDAGVAPQFTRFAVSNGKPVSCGVVLR
jgi:catechol 2,3-dioxygenase-like lactoylglutathione lyase family enzyme